VKDNHRKTLQASLLVAVSGTLYGFLGYLGTTILRSDMSISTMLFWRFLIAAAWILLFIIFNHSRKSNIKNYPNKSIGYAGCSGFYFLSSLYIGTGLAMVIFFSYPIMIAVGSWLIHRHKLNAGIVFTLITMTIGLFLIHNSSSEEVNVLGITFGVLNALCYAFYVMGSKQLSTVNIDSNVFTIMVCLGSSFIFLILALITSTFVIPTTLKNWEYILAVGILATAIPIQLMLEGLKYISSLRASIISVLEPLVTVVLGVILLNESISDLQMLGSCLILGSTLLVQFNRGL
jgi:drug/metabolite transporter (DMT)-like permease